MPFEIYKLCSLLAFLHLCLQIAALVTERWFIAGKRGTGIGLFEINSKGYIFAGPSTAICFLIYIAFSLFGCLCNVISIVYCIVEVCLSTRNQDRFFVKMQALIWFLSAGCLIASVIWIFISLVAANDKLSTTRSLSSISLSPGYSFYIGCVIGAVLFVSAIVITIIARRLPVVEAPPTGIVISGHSQAVEMGNGQSSVGVISPPAYHHVYSLNTKAGQV